MTLAIAVPFRGGALLAASAEVLRAGVLPEDPARLHTTVVKTPWGLLTGSPNGAELDRVRHGLLRSPAVTAEDLSLAVAALLPVDAGPCLLSYEPEETAEADPRLRMELLQESRPSPGRLTGAIRLYRAAVPSLSRLSWGAMLAPPGMPADQAREGELHLQWALDRGDDLDTRLEAVMATFAWFRERSPSLGPEVDVGIHEPGHRFSVDRMTG